MLDIISVLNNINASARSFNSKGNIITTCKEEVILVNKQNSFYHNELSCTTLRAYTRKILELSELFISLLPSNNSCVNNNINNNEKMTKKKKKKNMITITSSNTIKNATYILNLKETDDKNYLFKQLFITQIGADSDSKLNLLTKAQFITALHKIKIDIIIQLLTLADDQIKFHSSNNNNSSSSISNDDNIHATINVVTNQSSEVVVVPITDSSGANECINNSKSNMKKRKICDLIKHADMSDYVENDRDRDNDNDDGSSLHSVKDGRHDDDDDDYNDNKDDSDSDSGSSLHSIETDSDDDGYNVHTGAKTTSLSGDI